MAAQALSVQVNNPQQLESTVAGYIAQGFNVASRTATSVTMVKRKQFSILWTVIGFFLCVLPLLIYLIVYAIQSDQMVIINLVALPGSGQVISAPQMGALSAPQSGAYPATQTGPQSAPRSPDGNYWWDGQQWRPISELQGSQPQGGTGPYQQPGSMPQSGPYQQPGSVPNPYGQSGPQS